MGNVVRNLENLLKSDENSVLFLDSSTVLNLGQNTYVQMLREYLDPTSQYNETELKAELQKKTERNRNFKSFAKKHRNRVKICPEVEKELREVCKFLQKQNRKNNGHIKEDMHLFLQSTHELIDTLFTTDYHELETVNPYKRKYLAETIEQITRGIEKKLKTLKCEKTPSYSDIKQVIGAVMLSKWSRSDITIVTRDNDLQTTLDLLENSPGYRKRIGNSYSINTAVLPIREGEIKFTRNYGDFQTQTKIEYE